MAWSRLVMLPELIDSPSCHDSRARNLPSMQSSGKNKKVRRTELAKNQDIERSQDAIIEHL
jgi:hypothetical protein